MKVYTTQDMERIKKLILLGLPLNEREKAEFMLFYENEELARLMFNGVEQ